MSFEFRILNSFIESFHEFIKIFSKLFLNFLFWNGSIIHLYHNLFKWFLLKGPSWFNQIRRIIACRNYNFLTFSKLWNFIKFEPCCSMENVLREFSHILISCWWDWKDWSSKGKCELSDLSHHEIKLVFVILLCFSKGQNVSLIKHDYYWKPCVNVQNSILKRMLWEIFNFNFAIFIKFLGFRGFFFSRKVGNFVCVKHHFKSFSSSFNLFWSLLLVYCFWKVKYHLSPHCQLFHDFPRSL